MNWLYQVPDTSIHIGVYFNTEFENRLIGWAYSRTLGGVHTTSGGDTNWLTGIKQISNTIPKDYKLYQNYPNPFNPNTIIKYELKKNSYVNLTVFDIRGKEILKLVEQKQSEGTYQVDLPGICLSSGVYFYKIIIATGKEVFSDTKKMIVIK